MEYKTRMAHEIAFKRIVKGVASKLVEKAILEDKAWLDAMIDGDGRLEDAMEAFHCSILQQMADDVRAEVESVDHELAKNHKAVFSCVLEALGGMHRHPVKPIGRGWKTAIKTIAKEAMKCPALDNEFPGWRETP